MLQNLANLVKYTEINLEISKNTHLRVCDLKSQLQNDMLKNPPPEFDLHSTARIVVHTQQYLKNTLQYIDMQINITKEHWKRSDNLHKEAVKIYENHMKLNTQKP